jgi:hypothetical protein
MQDAAAVHDCSSKSQSSEDDAADSGIYSARISAGTLHGISEAYLWNGAYESFHLRAEQAYIRLL